MFAVLLGLATAGCKAGKNIGIKYATSHASDAFVGWGQRFTTFLCLLPILLVVSFELPLNREFLFALAAAASILGASAVLSARALRLSDISLVTPIYSFTPLLVLGSSYILIGEVPTPAAVLGIVLIVGGTYLLNITAVSRGPLEPIRALVTDKGVQTAAIVVVLGAVLPPIDKLGIQASSPLLWPLFTHALISCTFLPLAVRQSTRSSVNLRKVVPFLLIAGVANALLWIAQSHAYTLTNVAYITALKRVALPLNIVAGYVLFDEQIALTRLPAALLILAGVVLLTLGGF